LNISEGDDAASAELDGLLGAVEDLGAPDPFEAVEAEDPAEAPAEAGAPEAAEGGDQAQRNGPPKQVPYKRLQQVVRQRNELQAQLAQLQEAESKLRNELSGAQGFREAFQQRYGKFRNPVAQLALDADFMSALEGLSKTDPDVGSFYKKVMSSMGQNPPQQEQQQQQQAPAVDTRLDAVVHRHAELTIKDVLAPLTLQDRYQKMVVNHVMQNAKDLAALDSNAVKQLARQFIADSGFTIEEMRKAQTTPVKPTKPKTAGAGGGASPAAPKTPAKAIEKPKSREDYLQRRENMLSDLITELMIPQE
jgi:hypothetical protein